MRLKIFMRGVGAGILLATIVLFVAYKTNGNTISDEEIIKQAKELGMVEASQEDDKLSGILEDSKTTKASEETTAEANATTEETTEVTTEETTTEVSTTEAKATIEESTVKKGTKVGFTINKGMTSTSVAKILESQGVVTDYADFDKYLEDNGYASRISTGTFEVQVGDTYEEIAKILCP